MQERKYRKRYFDYLENGRYHCRSEEEIIKRIRKLFVMPLPSEMVIEIYEIPPDKEEETFED